MVGYKYFSVDECKCNSNICAILQLHNTTFCSLETSRNLFHFQIKNFFSDYNSADGVNKTKPKRWYEICNCLPKRIIIIDLLYMLPTFDTGVGNLGMTIILRPSNLSTTNNGGCHQLVLINQIRIFQLFLNEGEPPLTSPALKQRPTRISIQNDNIKFMNISNGLVDEAQMENKHYRLQSMLKCK